MGRPRKEIKDPAATSDGIQFFGDVDLTDDNRVKSQLPAWYFDRQIDDMQEGIDRKKRAIKNRMIKEDQIPITENQIKAEEGRLKDIIESRPNLSGNQKDRCASAYQMLSEQIQATMPTRKQSRDGLVSPHQELKRMKGKHIKVDPDIAAACGVKMVGGKISGDEAARCYKILGKVLGENTNVEALRRDGNSEAYQSINDLTRAILNGAKIGA
jgi:tellurite resistance protein